MWGRAAAMARDHLVLGVGPGNYSDAMRKAYVTAADPLLYQYHAHNTILQVAAESGIPALVAFLLIWWRMLADLSRICGRTRTGVVALGLFGALVTLVVRSLGDHFLSGLPTADRVSFLVWTLLAASTATIRYGRSRVHAGAAALPLQHVVEEDGMRLAGVRSHRMMRSVSSASR
jgi:O-antigen ligase